MSVSPTPWYRQLYVYVLLAVALGIGYGHFWPEDGKNLKPLGDGFIAMIKMIIAPIIFCTVVHGVASMTDVRKLGRIGIKTIIYFEIVSTIALIIGLVVVNELKPGAGFNIDVSTLKTESVQRYIDASHSLSTTDFVLGIIPKSFFGAFTDGNILQVLFVAILTAIALSTMGTRGQTALRAVEVAQEIFYSIMKVIVWAAPIGAYGAMAFTVGSYGIGSLNRLLALMFSFYLTAIIFILVVLGLIAWFSGFSIFRFLIYIKEELLLVLGTSSSETALPGIMEKTRRLGCAKSTVGLVVPLGYSFNLDGTNIYLTMATIFLAQATNTPLSLTQEITLIGVAMLSSKGASGVTGAGFITLAATLAIIPSVPVASIALLVGIDRFMSECRALTNLVGNGVATIVISRWEKEVTAEQIQSGLAKQVSVLDPA